MSFIDDYKKKKELKKTKQKYFKKKEKPLYFMTTFSESHPKLKRALKISLLGVMPVLLILGGTALGLNELNKDNLNIDRVVEINKDYVTRRVFLLSKENDTIPLKIKMDKMNSLHEEIVTLFSLLKEDSEISTSSLKGVIPSSTRLLSFSLENGLLSMNLSNEFLEYENKLSQEKMLDSLIFTMTQFDDVEKVSLYVDDIEYLINKDNSSGINTIKSKSISSLLNKKLMTYFYEKELDDKLYYVPVSLYVEDKNVDNLTFYSGSKIKPSISSGLKRVKLYDMLSNNQEESLIMKMEVKNDALVEEDIVNKDLYDLILLSLNLMNWEEEVVFTLDGEELQVDGIIDSDDYKVSSIVYNEIQL